MSKITLAIALVLVGAVIASVASEEPDSRIEVDGMTALVNLDAQVSYKLDKKTTEQFNFKTDGIEVHTKDQSGLKIIKLVKSLEDVVFSIMLWFQKIRPQHMFHGDVLFNVTSKRHETCGVHHVNITTGSRAISFNPQKYDCLGGSQVMANVDIKKFKFEIIA